MYDGSSTWIEAVGQPIGTFYGFRTNGLLTQEDIDSGNYITDGIKPNAGDIKYVDLMVMESWMPVTKTLSVVMFLNSHMV